MKIERELALVWVILGDARRAVEFAAVDGHREAREIKVRARGGLHTEENRIAAPGSALSELCRVQRKRLCGLQDWQVSGAAPGAIGLQPAHVREPQAIVQILQRSLRLRRWLRSRRFSQRVAVDREEEGGRGCLWLCRLSGRLRISGHPWRRPG